MKDSIISKWMMALILSLGIGMFCSAHAASSKHSRKKYGRSSSARGDAFRPKTSLRFDGRTVEGLRDASYDLTVLGDGDGVQGARRLYSLPRDFQSRAESTESEMRVHP